MRRNQMFSSIQMAQLNALIRKTVAGYVVSFARHRNGTWRTSKCFVGSELPIISKLAVEAEKWIEQKLKTVGRESR